MTGWTIRLLGEEDRAGWLVMRTALFPEESLPEQHADIDEILRRDDWDAFGVLAADGAWLGFIELGERAYAEGCLTSPVGFVEALWVADDARRQGIARALIETAKDWAGGRGRSELASDVRLDNLVSQAVHDRLGFEETERLVCYRMGLGG